MRIEILALTNLHLDIHEIEGILEIDLYICTWRPPESASSGLHEVRFIFDIRIEILALINLHEGKLEFDLYICTWWPSGLASSGLQEVRYYF